MDIENTTVAVVGLGYVGLPLAVAFGRQFRTIGFDLDENKLSHYRNGFDPSGEVDPDGLKASAHLEYHSDPQALAQADYIVVAVPTPIDHAHRPDLSPLEGASRTVGQNMRPGTTVVFESTVYPGCTEEVCVPILEKMSGLNWSARSDDAPDAGFSIGYSPERINPGDKEHRLETIIKVVSGDSPETLENVAQLYEAIITAGVHRAPSVAVAEAAKVIENTQRDLNIALMNELAVIFHKLNIDTSDVLKAAGTKWNFLKFTPGLVGGHCIGVDPYYLTYKAESVGHHPQVILAGRHINDGMGKYIAGETVKGLIKSGHNVKGAKVVVLGLTFKEDCPDLRNSKVADVIRELEEYGCDVSVHDPMADADEAAHEYQVQLTEWDKLPEAQALVLAVSHRDYLRLDVSKLAELMHSDGFLVDVKAVLDRTELEQAGIHYWRL